jgi:hypothetical protein
LSAKTPWLEVEIGLDTSLVLFLRGTLISRAQDVIGIELFRLSSSTHGVLRVKIIEEIEPSGTAGEEPAKSKRNVIGLSGRPLCATSR